MYTLKSFARRSTMFGAALAMVAAAIVPAASVFADALNPLTERSLLLSSSAPGFQDTDGSGNSEGAPNAGGQNFAPPGSGPNGKKTGQTFTFRVSTNSADVDNPRPIQAFTFQYCTSAAGNCQAPGDNTGDADPNNDGNTADSTRQTNAVAHPTGKSDLDVNYTTPAEGTDFDVIVDGTPSTGWTMTTANREDVAHSGNLTGKNNYITLVNAAGASPEFNDRIQIVFKASSNNYITNPGSGSFFVKINTYDSDDTADHIPEGSSNIDGGVTVANVMTDSIHITTKVLETMAFSVGTRNRDTTIQSAGGHGTCDAILQDDNNRLNLGNPDAEYSLETGRGWDVKSYWRLSSNSSGGATVYYSGNTLANTVGDEIADMPTEVESTPGTEQFGLGFVSAAPTTAGGEDTLSSSYLAQQAAAPERFRDPSSAPFKTLSSQASLNAVDGFTDASQTTSSDYDEATGSLFETSGQNVLPGTAKFKFLKSSLTVPEPIAQQNERVISCATAKMRYVANIGADTPAGVYTTKINFLAAPQY